MSEDDRFCPECEVSLDLHDGPDTCESAGRKADLLDQFLRPFAQVRDA